jgi:hypothetical protein
MKIHLAGYNPYPGIVLIRLYESWISERLGKFGGGGFNNLYFRVFEQNTP